MPTKSWQEGTMKNHKGLTKGCELKEKQKQQKKKTEQKHIQAAGEM